ncbi:hypothetical protein FQA39_LY19224 [Lamprigera yunnana]|nr:hypothetical protein FQA39_LY19224 [Lamprigera yunnana]
MLCKITTFLLLAVATIEALDWWQNAVIYQIYPRSFKVSNCKLSKLYTNGALQDSNNDGTGDLNGIIQKLDHLVDAGVTALWLSPIYKSPQVDFGYDISDFRDIDPLFGNLDTFKELVQKAKQKSLKIVLDFVPNHSSNEHEWFKKSEDSVPGYEDYYIWKDGDPSKPPNSWTSYFHGPAWTFSQKRKQWYLHQFASGQPDLNYHNPKVVQEMKDVLVYWLDMGVDGFRIDIISALFEHKDFPDGPEDQFVYRNDQPETYDMVYQWRTLLDKYKQTHGGDTRVMMTETYSESEKLFPYYGNETHNGAHFSFNFWFITKLNKLSNAGDIKSIIDQWYNDMPKKYTANWVLGNHDQHRVASRYTPEHVDGLNMIAMLLPGVAVTYNGEEIGMENGEVSWAEGWDPQGCNGNQEDWEINSRDFERTPYHWDSSVNAGFNEGNKTWLPVSEKYKTVNLAAQRTSERMTHYRVYQELVKLRKLDTVKFGDLNTYALETNVFVFTRKLEGNSTYIAIVSVNHSETTVDLRFADLPPYLSVKIPSVQSNKPPGSIVTTNAINLVGYEALVLAS